MTIVFYAKQIQKFDL